MDQSQHLVATEEDPRLPNGGEVRKKKHAEVLHDKDLRTNLSAFSNWLEAYLVSPERQLSHQGVIQLKNLVKKRRADLNYSVGRYRRDLTIEALEVMHLWEEEPIQKGTAEHGRARIRMIRDMMLLGRLEEQEAKGFGVTQGEKNQALLLLWTDPEWGMCKCRTDLNRPFLKELKWDSAFMLYEEGTQSLVDVHDGVPRWKQDYEAYCDRRKAAKQEKLAKRMNTAKTKQKEKNKARKARKRQAEKSGSGASMPFPATDASRGVAGGEVEDNEGGDKGDGDDFDGDDDGKESDDGVWLGDHGPEPVEGIWR